EWSSDGCFAQEGAPYCGAAAHSQKGAHWGPFFIPAEPCPLGPQKQGEARRRQPRDLACPCQDLRRNARQLPTQNSTAGPALMPYRGTLARALCPTRIAPCPGQRRNFAK